MNTQLNSEQVWEEISKEIFAVLGMVTKNGEARTVGIVYSAHHGKLYIATAKESLENSAHPKQPSSFDHNSHRQTDSIFTVDKNPSRNDYGLRIWESFGSPKCSKRHREIFAAKLRNRPHYIGRHGSD